MTSNDSQWEVWDDSVFESAAATNYNELDYSLEKKRAEGKSLRHEIPILPSYEASSSTAETSMKGGRVGYGFSEYSLVEKPPPPSAKVKIQPPTFTIRNATPADEVEHHHPPTLPLDNEHIDEELPPFSPTPPMLDGPEYQEAEDLPPSFSSEAPPSLRSLSLGDTHQTASPPPISPTDIDGPSQPTPSRYSSTHAESILPTTAQRLFRQSVSSVPSNRMGPRPMPSTVAGRNRTLPSTSGANVPTPSHLPVQDPSRRTSSLPYVEFEPDRFVQPPLPPPAIHSTNAAIDPRSLYHSSVSSYVTPNSTPAQTRSRYGGSSDTSSVSGYTVYSSGQSFVSTSTYSTSNSR